MRLRNDPAELRQIIDPVANDTLGMDLTWERPCGVASYGVSRAFEATGNEQCLFVANITSAGRVLHVSGGSAVMNDIAGDLGIDRKWAQGWGQGLALAFLAAAEEEPQR